MEQRKSFPAYVAVVVVLLGAVLAATIALGAAIVNTFMTASEDRLTTAAQGVAPPAAAPAPAPADGAAAPPATAG